MTVDEIKEKLYRHYDIDEKYADGERGCYVNGYWLSINEILEIIKD